MSGRVLLVSVVVVASLWLGRAWAGPPAPPMAEDLAWFAGQQGELAQQQAQAAALLADDPDNLRAHWLYLSAWVQGAEQERLILAEAYRRWAETAPEDPVRRLAHAYALTAAARPSGLYQGSPSFFPSGPGEWCGAVLERLEPLPEEEDLRTAFLQLRLHVEETCALTAAATRAELASLSPEDAQARRRVILAQVQSEITPAVAASLVAAAEQYPAWLSLFEPLWRSGATGEGLSTAQSSVLTVAEAYRESDVPIFAWSAQTLLRHVHKTAAPLQAPSSPDVSPLAEALVVIDPQARLEALLALSRRDRRGPTAGAWAEAHAETLQMLGRESEALRAWDRAWRESASYSSNMVFARLALQQGARLRAARKAADVVVGRQERLLWYSDAFTEPTALAARREQLAEVLTLRAEIHRALGRDAAALRDAQEALVLAPTGHRHLLVGLLTRTDAPTYAVPHLSVGLALAPTDELAVEAEPHYRESLPPLVAYVPGGVDGWQQAVAAVSVSSAAPVVSPRPQTVGLPAGAPFPNLLLDIDGSPRHLWDLPGPLVVELWATWCGPCKLALPQVEQTARAWTDRGVTVLLVSVDESAALAADYLQDSLQASLSGWAGPAALTEIGISGIPTTFLLDAEHRVIHSWSGWGSGDDRLEAALLRLSLP